MRDAIRGNQRQSAQLLEERLPMRDAIRGDQRTRGALSDEGRNQRPSAARGAPSDEGRNQRQSAARGAPSDEGRNQRRSAHLLEERLQIIGEDSECHTQGGLGLL